MCKITCAWKWRPQNKYDGNRSWQKQVSGLICIITLIARFMGPTWGPSGADRTGPTGPRWAPCWPMNFAIWVHELRGMFKSLGSWKFVHITLFSHTSKEATKLCFIGPLWGNPLVTGGGFFSQRANNAQSVSMSWHQLMTLLILKIFKIQSMPFPLFYKGHLDLLFRSKSSSNSIHYWKVMNIFYLADQMKKIGINLPRMAQRIFIAECAIPAIVN